MNYVSRKSHSGYSRVTIAVAIIIIIKEKKTIRSSESIRNERALFLMHVA